MKIKKYIAPNFREGKERIFQELGEETIILSTRNINNLDGSGDSAVEIVAAIDENYVPKSADITSERKIQKIKNIERSESANSESTYANDMIFNEINEIKNSLNELKDTVFFRNLITVSSDIKRIYKIFENAGFSEHTIMNAVIRMNLVSGKMSFQDALKSVGTILTERIDVAGELQVTKNTQFIAFIGTAGSGKTTTLIKLAILCKLILNAKVLIVSADSIKIGGADQLQTYSSIASIPFRSINSSSQLIEIKAKETDYDFILIDTPGVSLIDLDTIKELKNLLNVVDISHVFLTLQASLSKSTLENTLSAFHVIEPDAVILTKTDETTIYGELFEVLSQENIPIAYLTNGANVPDDIEVANKKNIREMVIPNLCYEGGK